MGERRSKRKVLRPATTPEGRENQLISLSMDLAEKWIIEGTAPAQVVTHFLKLASTRERLEQSRIENENLLLSAKISQIQSAKKVEELYEAALKAMRKYSGQDSGDSYDEN